MERSNLATAGNEYAYSLKWLSSGNLNGKLNCVDSRDVCVLKPSGNIAVSWAPFKADHQSRIPVRYFRRRGGGFSSQMESVVDRASTEPS